jgi:chromosome segregation ATPase
MARIAKTLVTERECFAFELFKTGLSVKEANDKMLLKYGSKMATTRLGELRKSALAEVFGLRQNLKPSIIDPTVGRLQEEIARLQLALCYANDKETAALPTRSQPEDLKDLEMAYTQNREMAIKIQALEDKIGELNGDISDSAKDLAKLEVRIELYENEIAKLESEIERVEEYKATSDTLEQFIEGICDRKGVPVDELKLAIQATDIFKACKIIGL